MRRRERYPSGGLLMTPRNRVFPVSSKAGAAAALQRCASRTWSMRLASPACEVLVAASPLPSSAMKVERSVAQEARRRIAVTRFHGSTGGAREDPIAVALVSVERRDREAVPAPDDDVLKPCADKGDGPHGDPTTGAPRVVLRSINAGVPPRSSAGRCRPRFSLRFAPAPRRANNRSPQRGNECDGDLSAACCSPSPA